ncbi:MAG: hypothetical protein ACRC30_10985 [Clostridium sp.]
MIRIDEEKAIMEFGEGDIGINTYVRLDIEEKGIIFYNQEKRNVGEMADLRAGECTSNIDDYPVKMVFNKIESVDVVINMLKDLKVLMKNKCTNKGNMIIGDGKIEMSESDFIELATRLGNDIDVCSFEGNNCVNGCTWCWSKYLNKFINI